MDQRTGSKALLLGKSLSVSMMLATSGAAFAVPVTFNFSGAPVDFITPITGIYDITAAGGQGGDGGRSGSIVSGDFSLTAGEALQIVVGQAGGNGYSGGGGGGSSDVNLINTPLNTPLLMAMGGSGISINYGVPVGGTWGSNNSNFGTLGNGSGSAGSSGSVAVGGYGGYGGHGYSGSEFYVGSNLSYGGNVYDGNNYGGGLISIGGAGGGGPVNVSNEAGTSQGYINPALLIPRTSTFGSNDQGNGYITIAAAVPELSKAWMLGIGLLAVAGVARKRKAVLNKFNSFLNHGI